MVRRATAQDVADLAGVSRSSVSLVLNGRGDGNIAAVKQRAIFDAARQLDYRPNTLALSLRSRRTMTLGVLSWQGVAGFPQTLLHSCWERANSAGYLPILMDTAGEPAHERRAVTLLLDRQVDAFVVVAPELVEYQPPDILLDTPLILVNCAHPEAVVSAVVPDEFGAAATATGLLIERGHVRIALLSDRTSTLQMRDRIAGVRAALRQAELPPPLLLEGSSTIGEGYRLARAALSHPDAPTGLVCLRERLAVGALLATCDLGLDVPGAVSLVSLDDGENLAPDLVPKLTSIRRPDRVMAEQAVAVLIEALGSGAPGAARRLSFVCPVELGGSVAVAPQPSVGSLSG